jgi:uncharacterized protein (DUF58 family)
MASLLRRVKTTIAIHAHRKVRGMLEGEYTSVVHGRSMEFDDLRPYVAGDEVKDIDWKATAKLGTPMTKRFIASRKHTLLLVVDTGRSMAALAEGGEQKRDLAVLAAGTAGYIASRHGDRVALVSGDSVHSGTVQPGSTEAHLERILQRIHSTTTLGSAPSSLLAQLRFAAKAFHRRMIVLVIADDRELGEEEQHVLRRLSVQHEVLWFTIADADLVHAGLGREQHARRRGGGGPSCLPATRPAAAGGLRVERSGAHDPLHRPVRGPRDLELSGRRVERRRHRAAPAVHGAPACQAIAASSPRWRIRRCGVSSRSASSCWWSAGSCSFSSSPVAEESHVRPTWNRCRPPCSARRCATGTSGSSTT